MKMITPLDGPYIQCNGKKMLDFSSMDFLGMAQHPEVKKNAIKYTLRYGIGVPSSSLGSAVQQQLEEKLAHFLGMEAAIFFYSYEEAKQAVSQLKIKIESSLNEKLPALIQQNQKEKGLLCVDDSDTFGILGPRGFGLATELKGVELILGSFTKGGGNFGAYIATNQKIRDKFSPSSTFPPAVLGALDTVFSLIPEMDTERKIAMQHTAWLKKQFSENRWKTEDSRLPLLTIVLSSAKEAEKLEAIFAEKDIFVGSLEKGQIVLTLSALHTPDDLDQLGLVLKSISATDFAFAMQSLTPTPRR